MTHDELLQLIEANEEFYGDGLTKTPHWTALSEVVKLHYHEDYIKTSRCRVDGENYPCSTIETIEKELNG